MYFLRNLRWEYPNGWKILGGRRIYGLARHLPKNKKLFVCASKKVANILENYFDDVGRVGLMVEGTGIDHAHIKLVPLHGTENLKKGIWEQVLSGKEFWFDKYEGWISSGSGPMADPEELKKLASEIRQHYGNKK